MVWPFYEGGCSTNGRVNACRVQQHKIRTIPELRLQWYIDGPMGLVPVLVTLIIQCHCDAPCSIVLIYGGGGGGGGGGREGRGPNLTIVQSGIVHSFSARIRHEIGTFSLKAGRHLFVQALLQS